MRGPDLQADGRSVGDIAVVLGTLVHEGLVSSAREHR